MAKSTTSWPKVEYARPAGRPSKYPWTEWFDGGVWKLEQGSDFTTTVDSFRVTIRGAAKRLGYTVEIRRLADSEDVLYVQGTRVDSEPTE